MTQLSGGGSLINVQGGFGGVGTITSVPTLSGATMTSQVISNYSGRIYNSSKHAQMPPGWWEIPDGIADEGSDREASAVRAFQGPWGNRLQFVAWAMGSSYLNDAGKLRRIMPAQHPEKPWLYATNYRLVGTNGAWGVNPTVLDPVTGLPLGAIAFFDNSSGSDIWSARYAVTYRTLDYDVFTDDEIDAIGGDEINRFVTRSSTYALQALPIPGDQLTFTQGPPGIIGTPIGASSAVKILPSDELTYEWHSLPTLPYQAIAACEGKCNKYNFDSLGAMAPGGYAAETLQMLTPKRVRRRTQQGLWVWDITYKFLFRPDGHNAFPAKDGQMYQAAGPGGQKIVPTADFGTLFGNAPQP